MASERPPVVLVLRAFIRRRQDGKYLIIRRAKGDRYNPGMWECAGGKLEEGEDCNVALENEVHEECGIMIEHTQKLAHVDSYLITEGKYEGYTYVVIFTVVRYVGGRIKLSDEHDAFRWVAPEQFLKHNLTPEVERAAKRMLAT